jgi:hypothetical protein
MAGSLTFDESAYVERKTVDALRSALYGRLSTVTVDGLRSTV